MNELFTNERFLGFLEAIGTPVLILLAFMFAAWRAASWIGHEVIKPMTNHQASFLEAVSELAQRNSEMLAGLKQSVDRLERSIESLIITKYREDKNG